VEPDWRLEDQFVVDIHQNALVADSSATTHPITASVHSPAQISSIFDSISYDKGQQFVVKKYKHIPTDWTKALCLCANSM
jgi:aminopeptidase N